MAEDTGSLQQSVTSTARNWLGIYLKGVFMGAADSIPGVSGGTIALITGIYERLVTAISGIDLALLRDLLGRGKSDGRLPLRSAAERIDLPFLFVLGLGILTAILTVTGVLAVSLERYRAPTNAFFFGLIAASAIVLYGEVALDTPRRWIAAVIAAGFAFLLTGATAAGSVPHGLAVVLLSGLITSSAMLLPGISGAALLYVIGQYEYMIGALHGFIGAVGTVLGGGDTTAVASTGTVVATFLVGVGVGLLTVAHGVRWALRRDRGTTLTVLVSLMVGALRLPVEEVLVDTTVWNAESAAGVGIAALLGGATVLLLDHYTDDLDYDV